MTAADALDLGPRRVARRRSVALAPEAIYAMLNDPRRHHELDGSGTVQPGVRGPERLALGDAFSVAMRLGPIRYRMRNTVTAQEQNRLLEWRLPAGHRWRWELVPAPGGGTVVTEIFDYRASPAARIFEALGIPAKNARGIEHTLARLAERPAD